MKIKMLETQRGSVDGCRVATYEACAEYDLSFTDGERELASAFVNAGFAEPVGAQKNPASIVGSASAEQAQPAITEETVETQPVPRGRRRKG